MADNRQSRRLFVPILFGLAGTPGGVLSLLSPAAGHGWYSGLIGVLSLALAPLSIAAWITCREGGRPTLARAVVVIGILADATVIWATESEGWSYMINMGGMAVIWWALFLSWQVLAVSALTMGQNARAA